MANKKIKKLGTAAIAATMVVPTITDGLMNLSAKEVKTEKDDVQSQLPPVKDGYTYLSKVVDCKTEGNKVTFTMEQGERLRLTFLENNVFRMYMAAPGKDFQEDPTPNSPEHTATIRAKTDDDYYKEYNIKPVVNRVEGESTTIGTGDINVIFDEKTSMMTVTNKENQIILKETAPIQYKEGSTIQTLGTDENEYFYGGGTQNGRFSHKGEKIDIVNSNNWVNGGVASPNPFYWSTKGYGVVRNTWKPGAYDFTSNEQITTTHNEERFDAYFFIDPTPKEILSDYYEFTGKPIELPEYASYLGHLNCYNRDYWKETTEGNGIKLGDKWYTESQSNNGGQKETLNGDEPFSAKSLLEEHKKYDMPLGWFLPNDGYGCGYGQESTQDGNVANLKQFADEAISKGVQTGLWTQSNLYPADPSNPKPDERDLDKEVEAGTHAIKTDVAWVGAGYSFALNGVMTAYNGILNHSGMKPNVVSLDGWAGTQRYAGIWTGDQSGGQWEYIRFHIPTYIGTSLSGQPNVGSDMDGIFGGKNETVQTRDFQWKAFTTFMLDMDGWGSNQKSPWALGVNSESINRAYLKLKAQLMPYINTISHEATAEGGLPMVRAMFLEEPNAYTYGKSTQYQYMWGNQFLVAPIYQNTNADGEGNDIRNDIYLPSTSDVWVDYLTGKQYRGGQILNNFDAPLWKLPVFVKNGSIIPMYPENNNPEAITKTNEDGLDRTQRIVEFYPSGKTDFTAYEDDGKTHGGGSATTKYTSVVEGDKATLTAEKTVGSYESMVNERSTEFIVNVSKAPSAVKGSVAGKPVEFKEVKTLKEYNEAEGNVYFYDKAPETIVEQYASKGSKYENMEETQTPKLRVKSTDKVGIHDNIFQVVVEGFENKQDLGGNELDKEIAIPTGLTSTESFQVLSDVHIEGKSENLETVKIFKDALQDIRYLDPDSSAIMIPGDFTNGGSTEQYESFFDLIEKYSSTNPLVALGNHDVRWLCDSEDRNEAGLRIPTCKLGTSPFADRYLKGNKKYMGDVKEGQLYFDKWIDGYHFITLNTEQDLKDQAYLSNEQLDWLEKVIAEDASATKPIFLQIHQAFEGTAEHEELDLIGGESEIRLKQILKNYPQSVIFTGHIHNGIDLIDVYHKEYGYVVDVPCFWYSSYGSNKNQVGYQVDVNGENIKIRLRDYENNVYLDEYELNFNISDPLPNDPSDDVKDIVFDDKMNIYAGNEQSETGSEGPAYNLIDNNENTLWHTSWDGTNLDNLWVEVDLGKEMLIDGLRYLPRQVGSNGTIKRYKIEIVNEDGEYVEVSKGKWKANATWKSVTFTPVLARKVRLSALETVSSSGTLYASGAELRITKPVIDKDKLKAALDKAYEITAEEYTPASYEEYKIFVEKAQEVYEDEKATQEEVDSAVKAIQEAVKGLNYKAADYSELNKAMQEAESLKKEEYTEESWKILEEAMQKAEETKGLDIREQGKVDEVAAQLKAAMKNLKEKESRVEKEELYELLKAYGGYESTTYTKDSWEVFKEAYDKAKEVYENKNTTQEEVDKVIEELKVSGKQLVKAEVGNPEVGGEEPETGNEETEVGQEMEKPEEPVKTGVRMPVGLLMFTMVMGAGASIMFYRKKYYK